MIIKSLLLFEKKSPYTRNGTYPLSFLDNVNLNSSKYDIVIIDGDKIKLGSDRYKCFINSGTSCVNCGIEGQYFAKEKGRGNRLSIYHMNLYALDGDEEVLMTKDHIIPVSKGGTDTLDNYQTMCCKCNSLKGNKLEKMNYIKYFNEGILENKEETIESIENCKDFIEVFNESEDKFILLQYEKGWFDREFSTKQSNENNEVALQFKLGLSTDTEKSSSDNTYFKSLPVPMLQHDVDEIIQVLTKARQVISRLEKYCDNIKFEVKDKHVVFTLIFENTDNENKKSIKLKNILNRVRDLFKDYDRYKTIDMLNFPSWQKELNPLIQSLKDSLKNNVELSKVKFDSYSTLKLRYSSSESFENNKIIIKVGTFKYKNSYDMRYKAIKLTKDEINLVMKIIVETLERNIFFRKEEGGDVDYRIDGQNIIIKIND